MFKSALDSRRGEAPTGHKQYMDRLLIKCWKRGQMTKRRTCECKRPSFPHRKTYNYQTEETWKSNNTHEDNRRTSKAPKKKKRNSQTSDNEYSFEEINMKPKVDAKRALNFHGYI